MSQCFFVAALALIASTGELTNEGEPMIEAGESDGEYVVTFFGGQGGERRRVVVDDLLPVTAKDSGATLLSRDAPSVLPTHRSREASRFPS